MSNVRCLVFPELIVDGDGDERAISSDGGKRTAASVRQSAVAIMVKVYTPQEVISLARETLSIDDQSVSLRSTVISDACRFVGCPVIKFEPG